MTARSTLACVALAAGGTVQAAATCTVSAVGPAFGVYNPLNPAPTLSNGTVHVTDATNAAVTGMQVLGDPSSQVLRHVPTHLADDQGNPG